MTQNYLNSHPGTEQPVAWLYRKGMLILLVFTSLAFAVYTASVTKTMHPPAVQQWEAPETSPDFNSLPLSGFRTDSVASVVTKAQYLKTLLNSTQIASLQQPYTTTLARKWSNLPCGSSCRNGMQLVSTLTAAQLSAALDVIKAATGTASNEGYDEFRQVRLADKYLGLNGGGNGYDSTIYFLSFLNEPSTTGAWMLQFGGHHYAANIAFNGGKVVGTTPHFMGLEPLAFTLNNVTYTPLKQEHDSMTVMLAGLSSAQLATAKISGSYSDVLLSPGESNGNTNTFPTTKAGLKASSLTTAQKNMVIAAIRNYTSDADDSSGAVLQALYASQIDNTYIGWTGSGTSGDTSTFLNTNTNYVRIDGPGVWIEFICQTGVVFRNQIHYHTVYRDHNLDYGKDLASTGLPLTLLSFDAVIQGKGRLLSWQTADEKGVSHFEVQRSVNPAGDFEAITHVNAKGGGNTYTYNDNTGLNEDVIYYRLKMVDLDGYSKYSNVAAVKYTTSDKGISVYPNPASDLLTISNPENLQNASIRIISSTGKMVMSSTGRSGRKLNVDISGLAPGSYFVQLLSNGKVTALKFVKEK